jgi:hypothetical protein
MSDRKRPQTRHNKYMVDSGVHISAVDAQKISSVLELYIVSNIVNDAPVSVREQVQKDIQDLNRIQQRLVQQLDVSRTG